MERIASLESFRKTKPTGAGAVPGLQHLPPRRIRPKKKRMNKQVAASAKLGKLGDRVFEETRVVLVAGTMARMPREVPVHQTLQKGMMLPWCFLMSLPHGESPCFVFSVGGETTKRRSRELQSMHRFHQIFSPIPGNLVGKRSNASCKPG
jgi:hypothetical protein